MLEDESFVNSIGEYAGQRNVAGERDGDGTARFSNGDMYVGHYDRGSRHGEGLYVFKNGARYKGTWQRGLKHGRGLFHYPDGSYYDGHWKHDFKHGYGSYRYANRDFYEGSWREDRRHGSGTYEYYNLGVKFMGTWIDDRMEGSGQLIYPSYQFHGQWKSNLPIDRGCFVFENGCMQQGEFNHISSSKGVLPVWQAEAVVNYDPNLLPVEAVALQDEFSSDSLSDDCQDWQLFEDKQEFQSYKEKIKEYHGEYLLKSGFSSFDGLE